MWNKKGLGTATLLLFAVLSLYFLVKPKLPGKNLSQPLPLKYWDAGNDTPLIFYISGDAGFNNFSTYFSDALYHRGYDVYALDTKRYFWKKKTPEGAAGDFSTFLEGIFAKRKNQKLALVGYSFGADALPFILEKFPEKTRRRLIKAVIIDPSVKGDLEVSIRDYLDNEAGDWPTIPAVNKLEGVSLAVVLSDFSARYYPYQKISLPGKKLYRLPGNHRFNNDFGALSRTVVQAIGH